MANKKTKKSNNEISVKYTIINYNKESVNTIYKFNTAIAVLAGLDIDVITNSVLKNGDIQYTMEDFTTTLIPSSVVDIFKQQLRVVYVMKTIDIESGVCNPCIVDKVLSRYLRNDYSLSNGRPRSPYNLDGEYPDIAYIIETGIDGVYQINYNESMHAVKPLPAYLTVQKTLGTDVMGTDYVSDDIPGDYNSRRNVPHSKVWLLDVNKM